jgi:Ca2+-binding RTX toxin-like protein
MLCLICLLVGAGSSQAIIKANHDGWPQINGMMLINKLNASRPLDARVGRDPFDRQDPDYQCDGDHHSQACFIDTGACDVSDQHTYLCAEDPVVPDRQQHNELLGGHGNDVIHGGPYGDVLWADLWPNDQPPDENDRIFAGKGSDFIYASHGHNEIHTGGGLHDIVHARYGRGDIFCDSPTAIVNLSRRSKRRYILHNCKNITLKPVGTAHY